MIESGELTATLPCSHTFHDECLQQHYDHVDNLCPYSITSAATGSNFQLCKAPFHDINGKPTPDKKQSIPAEVQQRMNDDYLQSELAHGNIDAETQRRALESFGMLRSHQEADHILQPNVIPREGKDREVKVREQLPADSPSQPAQPPIISNLDDAQQQEHRSAADAVRGLISPQELATHPRLYRKPPQTCLGLWRSACSIALNRYQAASIDRDQADMLEAVVELLRLPSQGLIRRRGGRNRGPRAVNSQLLHLIAHASSQDSRNLQVNNPDAPEPQSAEADELTSS